VIAASGVLHHPRIPEIPGMDAFKGRLFHSARWDHSVPLDGKRIAVIGNGSTGVQIVSALAKRAGKLEHFQRTAQWIMPIDYGYFTEEERAAFRADPELLARVMDFEGYAAAVEQYTQAIIDTNSAGAKEMAKACLDNLENSIKDPVLKEKLRPDHLPLCYRLVWSPDYYQAIQHPNAELVTEGIERIEAGGIRTRDGKLHELDIIVLATGFHADRFMRPMQITGRDGSTLESLWANKPRAYYAITLPEFPNFFMLNGPNGPVGNFSLIEIAEHQWKYIGQLLSRVTSGDCDQISPTPQALADFEKEREAAAKKTVWAVGGCKSWYLDGEGIPSSWPWTFSRFVTEMANPRWEAFDLRGGKAAASA